MDFDNFSSYWIERISRDLAAFSDPGVEVVAERSGRSILCEWSVRARSYEARFDLSLESGVSVYFDGGRYSYPGFLASPKMGDLATLARMTLQSFGRSEVYVDTQSRSGDVEGAAQAVLSELIDREESFATDVFILTGDAGAGKTCVLKELVRRYAERHVNGASTRLLLYVNAQGRALARFNEALATELDDLRSTLTYQAIAVLTKAGIIVPVIDGFDELLGVSGYEDAFSSLNAFIEELDGQGKILASARSTYYEEEFVRRASSSSTLGSQVWRQTAVEIRSWGNAEVLDYVSQRCERFGIASEEVGLFMERLDAAFQGAADLKTKPLFVSRVFDLLQDGEDFEEQQDLLHQLVSAYIRREIREKLLDRNEKPILTDHQLRLLFREMAEEMWNQETRELDRASVREVANFVLEESGLSEENSVVVLERVPNLAFLTTGDSPERVRFEHEVFFSFFLGGSVSDAILGDGPALRLLLGRSGLSPEVTKSTVDRLIERLGPDSSAYLRIVDRLGEVAGSARVRQSVAKENCGRLVCALLRSGDVLSVDYDGANFRDLVFAGGSFSGLELYRVSFANCEFRRTDMTSLRVRDSEAKSCMFYEVLVSPESTLIQLGGGVDPDDFFGVRVVEDGSLTEIYDPEDVLNVLTKIGIADAPFQSDRFFEVKDKYVVLVERLLALYRKTNPVCTDDPHSRQLFEDPDWPVVQKHLILSGVVTAENRTTGGPRKEFLRRRFLPEQIMKGRQLSSSAPKEIKNFWRSLSEL